MTAEVMNLPGEHQALVVARVLTVSKQARATKPWWPRCYGATPMCPFSKYEGQQQRRLHPTLIVFILFSAVV